MYKYQVDLSTKFGTFTVSFRSPVELHKDEIHSMAQCEAEEAISNSSMVSYVNDKL